MLPKAARRQQQQQQKQQQDGDEERPLKQRQLAKHELPYEPLADASRRPATVTWRGTGADSIGVKDQANCGSCWWVSAACCRRRRKPVHAAALAILPLVHGNSGQQLDPGLPSISLSPTCSPTTCRSFGAAGAMEAAWFAATGRRVSFSEQQILDCSWGYAPGEESATMGERGKGA